RTLPPGYYLTSYSQLSGNGVKSFPELNRGRIQSTMLELNLTEQDAVQWFEDRGPRHADLYSGLEVTVAAGWQTIAAQGKMLLRIARENGNTAQADRITTALSTLEWITPLNGGHAWQHLKESQQDYLRTEMTIAKHAEFSKNIGEIRLVGTRSTASDDEPEKNGTQWNASLPVKSAFSPSLADLCQDAFAAIIVDEGVKIKGEETIIGRGCRQINAAHRLVMSATPIKNRFPDVFRLAHYSTGGRP